MNEPLKAEASLIKKKTWPDLMYRFNTGCIFLSRVYLCLCSSILILKEMTGSVLLCGWGQLKDASLYEILPLKHATWTCMQKKIMNSNIFLSPLNSAFDWLPSWLTDVFVPRSHFTFMWIFLLSACFCQTSIATDTKATTLLYLGSYYTIIFVFICLTHCCIYGGPLMPNITNRNLICFVHKYTIINKSSVI